MLSYCLKCRKKTESKNPKATRTKLGRIILLSKCKCNSIKQVNRRYKMTETVNNFLLAGDKFMPEMHLKQPRFTYSVYGPFTKKQRQNKKNLSKRTR